MLFNGSLKYISPIPYLVVLPPYRLLGPKMAKNRPSGHSKLQFWWFLIQLGRIWDKTRPSCITEQSFDEARPRQIRPPSIQSSVYKLSLKACAHLMVLAERTIFIQLIYLQIGYFTAATDACISIHILLHLMLPYLERLVDVKHKPRRAALWLSCVSCFKLPDSVFFGRGAFCKIDNSVGTPKCLNVYPRSWFPAVLPISRYRRYKFQ